MRGFRFFLTVLLNTLILTATAATPGADRPALRRVDDGLKPGLALMYYYRHPQQVLEGNSVIRWQRRDRNGQWQNIPGSDRRMVFEPTTAPVEYRAAVTPVSRKNETGAEAVSEPLTVEPDPLLAPFQKAVITCEGSPWILDCGLRKMGPARIPAGVAPVRSGRLTVFSSAPVSITPAARQELESRLRYDRPYSEVRGIAGEFLGRLKNYRSSGDLIADLEAAKVRMIDRMAELSGRSGFKHKYPRKTDEVNGMRSGNFLLVDFESQKSGVFSMGRPGWILWFPVNDINRRFVTNMCLTFYLNPLVTEFIETRDPELISLWGALLADQYANSPEQWEYVTSVPESSIAFNGAKIYWKNNFSSALRIQELAAGLACFAAADRNALANYLSAADLAVIVTAAMDRCFPYITPRAGVINQEGCNIKALLTAALMFRDFKAADECEAQARRKLKEYFWEIQMPDGSDTEQVISYWTYGPVGTLIECGRLFDGDRFDWIESTVGGKAAERSLALLGQVKPNCQYPNLQSTGEGDYWRSVVLLLRYFPNATAQSIYDALYKHKKVKTPNFTSVYLPYGGFFTGRTGWTPDALWFALKTSRYGKGHYDESYNHFSLNIFGQNVFDSAGGVAYFDHPSNILFHGSAGKNTVTVDGFSQLISKGKKIHPAFYTDTAPGRVLIHPDLDVIEGVYDGWYGVTRGEGKPVQPKFNGVRHHRRVLFLKPAGVWIVVDRLTSDRDHTFQQNWNMHSDYADQIRYKDGVLVTAAPKLPNVAMRSVGTGKLDFHHAYGQHKPEFLGWYKAKARRIAIEKAMVKASHLRFSLKGRDETIVTVIKAFKPGATPELPLETVSDDDSIRLRGADFTLEARGDTLKVTSPAGEFIDDGRRSGLYRNDRLLMPFRRPTGFKWEKTGDQLSPRLIFPTAN